MLDIRWKDFSESSVKMRDQKSGFGFGTIYLTWKEIVEIPRQR